MSLPFCPSRGRGSLPRSAERNSLAEVQRKNSPPVRGEHADAVRAPRSAGAEKKPPVRGELADAVRVPRSAGAEKEPPVRGEPLAQFACPRGSVPENKVYPLTNPDLTAIILKLIHKCREKEEYFSFARLER